MGSLEKGARTPKTDTKLVNKKSASGTISTKVDALELEKPAMQPENVKTGCVRRLCFQGVITAF